jgi:hypothetical protein
MDIIIPNCTKEETEAQRGVVLDLSHTATKDALPVGENRRLDLGWALNSGAPGCLTPTLLLESGWPA